MPPVELTLLQGECSIPISPSLLSSRRVPAPKQLITLPYELVCLVSHSLTSVRLWLILS
jgi:hypothetical protein